MPSRDRPGHQKHMKQQSSTGPLEAQGDYVLDSHPVRKLVDVESNSKPDAAPSEQDFFSTVNHPKISAQMPKSCQSAIASAFQLGTVYKSLKETAGASPRLQGSLQSQCTAMNTRTQATQY